MEQDVGKNKRKKITVWKHGTIRPEQNASESYTNRLKNHTKKY